MAGHTCCPCYFCKLWILVVEGDREEMFLLEGLSGSPV
jgi:hypothetical protein